MCIRFSICRSIRSTNSRRYSCRLTLLSAAILRFRLLFGIYRISPDYKTVMKRLRLASCSLGLIDDRTRQNFRLERLIIKNIRIILTVLLITVTRSLFAADIASDSADDIAYDSGWNNSSNGDTVFQGCNDDVAFVGVPIGEGKARDRSSVRKVDTTHGTRTVIEGRILFAIFCRSGERVSGVGFQGGKAHHNYRNLTPETSLNRFRKCTELYV